MMRAPIRADTHAPAPQGGNFSANKPSSKISEHRKMFENNSMPDTSSDLSSSINKTAPGKFGKKFDAPSTIAVPEEQPVKRPVSPKLPVKPAFTKGDNASPQLPPRLPGKGITNAPHQQQPADYEEEVKLDNIPAHLRDRFERARQRKTSKSSEGDTSPELRQLRAKEDEKQKMDKKGFKPPPLETSDKPETGGTSIKDRMKMFSSGSIEEEPPPRSPRWGGSYVEKKQTSSPSLSKPPVDFKSKTLPQSPKPQASAPALPSRNELPPPNDISAPPLPDRNTKPKGFGSKQPAPSPSFGKRPPMPAPVAKSESFDVSDNT